MTTESVEIMSTSSAVQQHLMQFSTNADICILETSAHNDWDDGATDFTVLHVPIMHLQQQQQQQLTLQDEQAPSATDSDVEVLLSEEIVDSDWSTSAAELDNCSENNDVAAEQHITNSETASTHSIRKTTPSTCCTDQDVSVQELSNSCCLQHDEDASDLRLNRQQLMKIIKQQAERISQLENTLQRYRAAQQTLCQQLDEMRTQFQSSLCLVEHEQL